VKLRDLTMDRIVHDPFAALGVLGESAWRNFGAEAWAYGLLFLALVICVTTDLVRRRSIRKRYGGPQFRVDAINGLLDIFHVVPILVLAPLGALIAAGFQRWAPWFRVGFLANLPTPARLAIAFVITDFAVYWWHRTQHMNKVVWQFHKVHHSQREMTALTVYRTPVADRVLTLMALALPAALLGGGPEYPFVVAALITVHQLLIHSDTGWSLGPLDRVIVTPSFHEVHHSSLEPHLDKNFGGALSIWDTLFGTYADRGKEPLRYGLVGEVLPERYWAQQFAPFVGVWRHLRGNR
jgi:sterol desaturase/sphingolipid hydroxylase (fatty acid hydroxylase superfamily)